MLEAFKIGIALSLINGVSGVLGTITRDFIKSDEKAERLQRRLKEIKLIGGTGLILGGAAFAGARALEGLIKPASAYADQLVRLKTLGLDQIDMAKATAAAWQTTHDVMTSTATENVKSITELVQVFGDVDSAIRYLPAITKVNSALKFVQGSGNKADGESFNAAKALELRGASVNPADFIRQLDLISKGVVATGGRVSPSDFLTYFKRAGVAGTAFDDRFTYGILPSLIQELGGNTAGTALMSAYQAIVGGRMTKASYGIMKQLGLADPKAGVHVGAAGTIQLDPKAVKGADLFREDPLQWVQKVLRPAEIAKGITDPKEMEGVLTQIFGNRNALKIINILEQQETRLEKDERQTGKAFDADKAYNIAMKEAPGAQLQAFNDQLENLKITLGNTLIPMLVKWLPEITADVDALMGWVDRHPNLTKRILEGAVALDALAGALSGFLIAVAGIKSVKWFIDLFGSGKAAAAASGGGDIAASGGGAAAAGTALATTATVGAAALGAAGIGSASAYALTAPMRQEQENRRKALGSMSGVDMAAGIQSAIDGARADLAAQGKPVPGQSAGAGNPTSDETFFAGLKKSIMDAVKDGFKSMDVDVSLDGRKVGRGIFGDIGLSPPTGASNFDSRLSPLYPATGIK